MEHPRVMVAGRGSVLSVVMVSSALRPSRPLANYPLINDFISNVPQNLTHPVALCIKIRSH